MGNYFLKIWFAILVCFSHTKLSILGFIPPSQTLSVKCIEKERKALLDFKQGLQDYSSMLSTWSDDDNNKDCCKWKGIECNNETGHVKGLLLGASNIHYLIGDDFSISPFLELQNMEYLDLSGHSFPDCQIPEQLGSFKNLRYLNLSYTIFVGGIPYQLGNLSNLECLDLQWSFLEGAIPSELGNLSKLEYLDLNHNDLYGAIPSQLGKLTSLQYLDLRYNLVDGEIPYQLGNLSQLRYLDLGESSLSGAVPFQVGNLPFLHTLKLGSNIDINFNDAKWLTSLMSLTTLHLNFYYRLSDNNISSLFASHSNLSASLSILDLSGNKLTSSTFQLLANCSLNLQELYLSNNDIVLSSPHYLNLPSLVILDLSYNNLTSSIFQENFNFSSKLQKLQLANCSLTDRSFLVTSTSMKKSSSSLLSLDLSSNLLKSSTIFHWISNFTTNLHSLSLDMNLLEGPIPCGLGKVMNSLELLSIASNKLQGEIPTSLGNICTLQGLSLNNNNLSGEISSFIQNSSWCNGHVFQTLDLSYNKITGMLPNISILTSLRTLDLSNNQLTGDITEYHLINLTELLTLDLSGNYLFLKFGIAWIPPFQLTVLGLASCKMGPNFPSWIETQSQLSFLDIYNAGIDDFVPEWLWNKLQAIQKMNMSCNTLRGTIPNLPIKDYEFLNPEHLLKSIDLSSNNLTGKIPREVGGYLDGLVSLNLSRNNLHGEIPCEIGNLASLEFIDLSRNHLSGKIPTSLSKIDRLAKLDLSNNCLVGRIPWGRQLQTLDVTGFEGNPGLCGEKLNKSCPGEETKVEVQGTPIHGEDDNSIFYEALYMSFGFGFFIGFWGLLGSILLWQPWRNSYLSFLNRLTLSILVMVKD
ncbi:hypothetical protein VNO78_32958 [Psophocarpus tetragonolobus]|uniref:Uncharacterized protein n=1 Tax=Psophocarpus tetragonolobus TaxID=3891 RepID=A0AAN9RQD5_PSOTE